MDIVEKTIGIAIVIIVLSIVGIVIYLSGKKEKVRQEKKKETTILNQDRGITQVASEQEKQNWKEWYDKAKKLSNEMMLLTGGPSGMVRLKDLYEEAEDKFVVSECKESFMRKQKRLKEAYVEYYKLKEQIDKLPNDAGRRIETLRNDELYKKLQEEIL